ncbi:hypothetical protein N0V93_007602 [Gnomoniopsis smithogilvyi]|uniref:Aminotransferase class V domain-containing protein n=1 Tax=Gnomoniopsis smithogilvyi TaxID=1191159 RepID=A0A9W8YQE0_9PEZI|nr:hypothetical protein N0V93_007602 [Gnomoniopsis smithogilvyi]
MGSCLSEISVRPKTATSSQSTVVDDEGAPTSSYKFEGDNEQNKQLSQRRHEGNTKSSFPSGDTVLPSQEHSYPLPFGKPVLAQFLHDPSYHNLNHASFGTIPSYISERLRHYQLLHERSPDPFIRYTYPDLLDTNRKAIAELINAPHVDEVVFVPNATVGVNTVLRALSETWNQDGNDEILFFSTIYGACGKTVTYVSDSTHGQVNGRAIELTYPISDAAILAQFHATVAAAKAEGKRPRVAVFDTVSSLPGVRFPYEAMVAACRELGILSLVDGAQAVGMIPLDVAELDPDFLVSNCHKWLFVPRGCAVFYVPLRNQHLIRSTVPTSHGYVPLDPSKTRANPLPPSSKSPFVSNFEYVGTLDNSPYLCVKDALEWRKTVLGGEERIRTYVRDLANTGGEEVAHALGTWVMRNKENTLADCGMVNVAMPLAVVQEAGAEVAEEEDQRTRAADVEDAAPINALETEDAGNSTAEQGKKVRDGDTKIPHSEAERIWAWMTKVLVDEYQTFIPTYYHDGRFWARLSAQVYLDKDDFIWAGKTLKTVCERVANKDYDL